jgi:hypothetical protein
MQAKICGDYLTVVAAWTVEGQTCISVPCADIDTYASLPGAVEFEGRLLGRTGWNSDRGLAYYKTGATLARKV